MQKSKVPADKQSIDQIEKILGFNSLPISDKLQLFLMEPNQVLIRLTLEI